jgi:hypothetical protein
MMMGRLVLVCGTVAALGCGANSAEPGKATSPTKVATADAFAGSWSSVTPSYEFIRLSIVSKSIEQGSLGARLTLSGLAFEGSARIDADSLIATMSVPGSTETNATVIAHARDANTLAVQFRSANGAPLALSFVRQ